VFKLVMYGSPRFYLFSKLWLRSCFGSRGLRFGSWIRTPERAVFPLRAWNSAFCLRWPSGGVRHVAEGGV